MGLGRVGASAAAKTAGMGSGVGAIGMGVATAAAGSAFSQENEKSWWVGDGFMAVRTRFGRAVMKDDQPVVYGPGFHPNIPFSHANRLISTQDRVCSLGHVAIKREDMLTLVHTEATWGIKETPKDVHAAWLRVKAGELDQRFASIAGNAFNIVMSCVPLEYLDDTDIKMAWNEMGINERQSMLMQKKQRVVELKNMTSEVAAAELATIGAEIRWLDIRSDAPHPLTQVGASAIAGAVAATEGEEFGQVVGAIA